VLLEIKHIVNEMQLEMADFAPVPPPGELDEAYALSLTLASTLHYVKIWCHPRNQKCIMYCVIIRRGQSHGHR